MSDSLRLSDLQKKAIAWLMKMRALDAPSCAPVPYSDLVTGLAPHTHNNISPSMRTLAAHGCVRLVLSEAGTAQTIAVTMRGVLAWRFGGGTDQELAACGTIDKLQQGGRLLWDEDAEAVHLGPRFLEEWLSQHPGPMDLDAAQAALLDEIVTAQKRLLHAMA